MIAFLLGIFILTSGVQMQSRYEHCKKKDFKGEYCKLQKKMSRYEKK